MAERRRIIRWKALWPLSVVLLGGVMVWWLLLDTIVARSVESVGTALVGARVEVDEADVRLGAGVVRLRGLRVTNPDRPMTNLVDAGEIVADFRVVPLLEKKIFIDTVALRDLRFGTAREVSGAVDNPSAESRQIREQINTWAERVRVPPFSIEGLSQVVNVDAIDADSLVTMRVARGLASRADSSRTAWLTQVRGADPQPVLARARGVLDSLEGATLRSLGLQGSVRAAQSVQSVLGDVNSSIARFTALDDSLGVRVQQLRAGVAGLTDARTRDLAYARGLLRLPNLDTPDFSASLLGEFAVRRLEPVLYWLRTADRYVPPGLDPRRRPGAGRARRAGTNFGFPNEDAYPAFTLLNGEASFSLATGDAAGAYALILQNITSAPALIGAPLVVTAERVRGGAGLEQVAVRAVFDHVSGIRDSITARLAGVPLPDVVLPGVGATMRLGLGETDLQLSRTGDSIAGRWVIRSRAVEWAAESGGDRVTRLVREIVTDVRDVEIEIRVSGSVRGPGVGVRSNIGRALASAVQNRLRTEMAAAEDAVRTEIERRVAQPVAEARALVDSAVTRVDQELASGVSALETMRAELQRRLRELRP